MYYLIESPLSIELFKKGEWYIEFKISLKIVRSSIKENDFPQSSQHQTVLNHQRTGNLSRGN